MVNQAKKRQIQKKNMTLISSSGVGIELKLELVNEPLKATQTAILIDLEDTMITIGKRSRIFPVIDSSNYEQIGYYLIGDIYLGADTIVNTQKGAVGEPLEKLAHGPRL